MGLPKSFLPPKEERKPKGYQLRNPELRAQLDRFQHENDRTQEIPNVNQMELIVRGRRLLYRGQLGELIPVVGGAIHSASVVGVTIVPIERGAWGQLRTIPWHRIVEFDTDPRDPIRNGTF